MVGHIGVLEDIPGYHYDFSTAPKRLRPLGALVDASHCCPDMPFNFFLASINIHIIRDFLSEFRMSLGPSLKIPKTSKVF